MSTFRGLPVQEENILITRGSQMSFYLVASVLIQKGDNVTFDTQPGKKGTNAINVKVA